MTDPTLKAIKEAKLKEEASKRTEVTEHCQEYLESLHEVMHFTPDQPEY